MTTCCRNYSEELCSQAELLVIVQQLKNILLPVWQSWRWRCPAQDQPEQEPEPPACHFRQNPQQHEQILLLSSGTLMTVFRQQLKSLFPAITHPASYVSSPCWQRIQSEEAANTKYRCIHRTCHKMVREQISHETTSKMISAECEESWTSLPVLLEEK